MRPARSLLLLAPLALSGLNTALAQCELQQLLPSAGAESDFAWHVALADSTAFLSARKEFAGSVTVYELTEVGWIPTAQLFPPDGAEGDWFGVSMGTDGRVLVVGASEHDGLGLNAGAAYVFEREEHGTPADRLDDTWALRAKLEGSDTEVGDRFGVFADMYGDTLYVGARSADVGSVVDAGVVYVFERSDAGTPDDSADDLWPQIDLIAPEDPTPGALFGRVSPWGSTLAVGANSDPVVGTESGSAYVFERQNSGTPDDPFDDVWTQVVKLIPDDAGPGEEFGYTSLVGDTLIVGAEDATGAQFLSGAAYVFERDDRGTPDDRLDDDWVQTAKFFAADGTSGDDFGHVRHDANRAVVGAYSERAVYVFERDDLGTASPFDDVWTQSAKLTPSSSAGGELGRYVALSGNLVMAGARGFAGYVWALGPSLERFPSSLVAADGGAQSLWLSTCQEHAGDLFWLLGSVSGTEPGVALGDLTLPLNRDLYFQHTLIHPGRYPLAGGVGVFGPSGVRQAALNVDSNPNLAGLVVHHAYVRVDLESGTIAEISNPRSCTLL